MRTLPWSVRLSLVSLATLLPAADLPVREVVLFKHGVGYFSRSGEIPAGDTARLDFRPGDMNDVLKSLIVSGRGGAKITGVRYDSSEPLTAKLAEYPFSLGEGTALARFLDQCKGAHVEIVLGRDLIHATVLGAQETEAAAGAPAQQLLSVLSDAGEVKLFSLATVNSVKFLEPEVQRQLKEYLGAVNLARSREKRSVYIDGESGKARQLSASYIIPAAVWKSSYRLTVGKEGVLEGWAVIDNTTGEDWNNVRLSLVSGLPISFISPLYEVKLRSRQVAELAEDEAAKPTVDSGDIGKEERLQTFARAKRSDAPEQGSADAKVLGTVAGFAAKPSAPAPRSNRLEADISLSELSPNTTETRETGELFEYRFSEPVTVKKSESAMLPFLQQKLTSQKIVFYPAGSSSSHPQNAVELVNTLGKTLDGGPFTVFEEGGYAGEGLLETLKQGDRRYLSYSVDLGTRISSTLDSSARLIREIRASQGVLTIRSAYRRERKYQIRNVDNKPKTLILEQSIDAGWNLVSTKPATSTANAYRFQIAVPAAGNESFNVAEEQLSNNSLAIAGIDEGTIAFYLQNVKLSDAGKKSLKALQEARRRVASLEAELKQAQNEIDLASRDIERLRQNINTLNGVAGQQPQAQRYAEQLGSLEAQISTLRERQAKLTKQKDGAVQSLNDLVASMEF